MTPKLKAWLKRENAWAEKLYKKGGQSGGLHPDWFAGYSAAIYQVSAKLLEKPKRKKAKP